MLFSLMKAKSVLPFDDEIENSTEEQNETDEGLLDHVVVGEEETQVELSPLPLTDPLLSNLSDNLRGQLHVLKQEFIEQSKNPHFGSVLEITKTTAQEYAENVINAKKTGIKTVYNVDSSKFERIDNQIERKDGRVSHEGLIVKFNIETNRCHFDHQESKSSKIRKRTELDFQYLIGAEINDSGVILDLKKFVMLEKNS